MQINLIDLGDDAIQNLSFEWSEHNGFIFDQKGDKATSLKMVNQILFIK